MEVITWDVDSSTQEIRVECSYINIAFHVDGGASAYWFAILIEYKDRDDNLRVVYLKQVRYYTF